MDCVRLSAVETNIVAAVSACNPGCSWLEHLLDQRGKILDFQRFWQESAAWKLVGHGHPLFAGITGTEDDFGPL